MRGFKHQGVYVHTLISAHLTDMERIVLLLPTCQSGYRHARKTPEPYSYCVQGKAHFTTGS